MKKTFAGMLERACASSGKRSPRSETGKSSGAPRFLQGELAGRIRGATDGEPLAPAVRSQLENRLGADLSGLRVHTGGEADLLARALDAAAFASGREIFFRAGAWAPGTPEGDRRLAHEAVHTLQQAAGPVAGTPAGGVALSHPGDPFERQAERVADQVSHGGSAGPWTGPAPAAPPLGGMPAVQRDGKKVGVAGGESQTPSDQDALAPGYKARAGEEDRFDTPDGRIVDKDQAVAESRVINSEGIFMGAYLARYNELAGFGLGQDVMDKLSAQAGFMKQFQTGDVVLRMMNASDSEGLATVTDSSYSHSGIVQIKGGRVWVLDSYPGRGADSTQLIRFEEFFSDHHGEEIVRGLVLRVKGMTGEIRQIVDELIDFYNSEATSFDREFKIDNGEYVLYCSELVYRILSEAGSPVLPPDEFEFTKERAENLKVFLQGLIEMQTKQGVDTSQAQGQLAMLELMMAQAGNAEAEELYSPGSLERTEDLKSLAGFTREGEIEGAFQVTVVSATIPDSQWETVDPYVTASGGLLGSGSTSVKDDTLSPVWNESILTLSYENLNSVQLEIRDSDLVFDDTLASFSADLRPVRPAGQTFSLAEAGSTLQVSVKEDEKNLAAKQAPRAID